MPPPSDGSPPGSSSAGNNAPGNSSPGNSANANGGGSPSSTTEPWTIGRLLSWATDDFKKRGFTSPRLEAEVLLCAVLGVDRVRLIVDAKQPLGPQELDTYRQMFRRRRGGEPSAYIVGRREFFGRPFFVDARVLVPRPETEILVELALDRTRHRHLEGRALDLCTGSGCVALSFALERPTWRVTGADVSEDALVVARRNALALGAVWGTRFVAGDLFDAVGRDERFEVIVANPPYIETAEIETLEPHVRDHEPRAALDGGATGLDFYPRLAQGARRHLVAGGLLAVEVGAGQAARVGEMFRAEGFTDIDFTRDYAGHERVVSGRAGSGRAVRPLTST